MACHNWLTNCDTRCPLFFIFSLQLNAYCFQMVGASKRFTRSSAAVLPIWVREEHDYQVMAQLDRVCLPLMFFFASISCFIENVIVDFKDTKKKTE